MGEREEVRVFIDGTSAGQHDVWDVFWVKGSNFTITSFRGHGKSDHVSWVLLGYTGRAAKAQNKSRTPFRVVWSRLVDIREGVRDRANGDRSWRSTKRNRIYSNSTTDVRLWERVEASRTHFEYLYRWRIQRFSHQISSWSLRDQHCG